MIAILSDIHANLEALQVVLADIKKRDISEVICLGDTIGYGPNPRECLHLISQVAHFSIIGNHEEAVLFDAADFHLEARKAVDWTRQTLNSSAFDKGENYRLWDYLGEMKKRVRENKILYVHASPRQPTREYIMPNDSKDSFKMNSIFEEMLSCQLCFVGHTHIPGIFLEDYSFFCAAELNHSLDLSNYPGKKIINVGSVGQPRDRDPRACYLLFDGQSIQWIRLKYDYQLTHNKIVKTGVLSPRYGDRLKEGR